MVTLRELFLEVRQQAYAGQAVSDARFVPLQIENILKQVTRTLAEKDYQERQKAYGRREWMDETLLTEFYMDVEEDDLGRPTATIPFETVTVQPNQGFADLHLWDKECQRKRNVRLITSLQVETAQPNGYGDGNRQVCATRYGDKLTLLNAPIVGTLIAKAAVFPVVQANEKGVPNLDVRWPIPSHMSATLIQEVVRQLRVQNGQPEDVISDNRDNTLTPQS